MINEINNKPFINTNYTQTEEKEPPFTITDISWTPVGWSNWGGKQDEERQYTVHLSNENETQKFTFIMWQSQTFPSFLKNGAEIDVKPNGNHYLLIDRNTGAKQAAFSPNAPEIGELPGWIDWFDEPF